MDTLILSIDSIKGNSVLSGFADKIMVDSYSIGVSLPMNFDVSKTERTLGRPSFSEMTLSKMSDISTPALYAACAAGTQLGDATLSLGRNAGGKFILLIKYVLSHTMVSGIQTSGGGGGAMDNFSLNYTTITCEFTQQNPDSTAKGTAQFGWNLTDNTAKS